MSGLLGEIHSNAQALGNRTASLGVIGTNIGNVNSSTYARQKVETTSYSGPGGVVFTSSHITSARDSIVDRQVVEETSQSGAADELASLYESINNLMSESLNGSLGASLDTAEAEGTGITGAVSTFFNAWSAYAASPNSSAAAGEVYNAAEELVSRLNTASADLESLKTSKSDELDADVADANSLLASIAEYNKNIIGMEARNPGSSATMKDEREAAMEKLAKLVNFDSSAEADGSVTITLASGNSETTKTLVSGGVAGSIAVTSDASGAYTGLSASFGGSGQSFTPTGGSLSVLNPTVVNAAVDEVGARLDAVANQLASAVNAAYAASDSSGTAAIFSGSGAGGISLAITAASSIKAASSGEAAGGNSVALAITSLRSAEYSISSGALVDGTLSEAAADIATDTALKFNDASEASDAQTEVLSMVRSNRDDLTGTSTDEEMSDLIREQHAFQASARVLSIVDDLLELVATRLGA
ncbi:MAG TPA: flagellar hook-associated protein FlgK [Opitutales bacterium]|nr:flagellar hook-associated protein FlgK [Opitutales bacterium]